MAIIIGTDEDGYVTYLNEPDTDRELSKNIQEDGYPEPTGTITITQNGSGIDVKDYASADVNVPFPGVLTYYNSVTPNEIITNENALQLQLPISTDKQYVFVFFSSEVPEASVNNSWALVGLKSSYGANIGNILRSDGTAGSDLNLSNYNKDTGIATLGGFYGYLKPGLRYDIYLFQTP